MSVHAKLWFLGRSDVNELPRAMSFLQLNGSDDEVHSADHADSCHRCDGRDHESIGSKKWSASTS